MVKCESLPYDGIENFTLFNQNSTILNGLNPSNYIITYHLSQAEADSNSNSLPNNYQNSTQSQQIFVRLQSNSNSVCYDITSFIIKVFKKPIINAITNISLCDDSSNDGLENFDFSNQLLTVLGSQSSSEFTITFHLSLTDAQQRLNEVQINYTNISNPQTIFVRIENNLHPECNDISDFKLFVKNKPELNLNDIYAICVGTSITINAPTGYSSYLWSNGSTSSSTTINQEGNYSLTAFNDYGDIICENTKDFVVNNSNIATIINVEIEDLNNNGNSVFVTVTGQGDYEYSLDDYNYQESSNFFNVPGGEYTVYVRDKKGCGVAYESVFLMMYPKFFTPNNDGFNDYWRIRFSNLEPKIKTSIYDRYGKLIKLLNGNQDSWDGTFNGSKLPATDYWFKVVLENGNEYKGHFSLKR
ncbi:T9SS type B sorting domain-containing protein [uncultured Flavobacterium sp.]|uniref:T9SS type B sorting domain-containing protein n=1 Tax=uncultured Flavobacterium sp. TaxID=165435 RepID=UPI0030EE8207